MRKGFDGALLKDSNCAGIGSKADKDLRKQAANGEAAWQSLGQQVGVQIWRIEKFQIVRWPQSEYGKFHKGDSYIVLHTTKRPYSLKHSWDIYFWLGSQTSQDEQGAAAYKTVELDDFLNGEAQQHREVEGFESKEFLGIFPSGIQYLEGGIESGFHHAGPHAYVARLLQVRRSKGCASVRIKEVPLGRQSLNEGDAFILDAGQAIYIWFGQQSNAFEKNMANTTAENLEREREGQSKVMDWTESPQQFWALLGGPGPIKSADDGDKEVDTPIGEGILYKFSDDSRTLFMSEVARNRISHNMLESSNTFILDTMSELFVWLGKQTSAPERQLAVPTALQVLATQNRPSSTPIKVFREGNLIRNKTWNQIMAD
eukprot:TRINITY_DN103323_c0_g1_i1.p1 TRINITY_DN103323_c0_g1~~TRINITY_DN103323_c0_g1_i1.p1  ORF type:complete len:372 (+),score=60.92 TRINITY_DN103323_c0_g1_i1:89-1204(+)